jgi:hypothetical protein
MARASRHTVVSASTPTLGLRVNVPSCYMCQRLATSSEHAPPLCIFPERKDTAEGTDYRRNLITVPSCDEHNSKKSRDDEYLLFALAGSYTSSNVGLTQFTTKVRRAFEHRPSKADHFVSRSAPVRLRKLEQVEWEDGLQVIVQGDRIDAVLENCARALYFHETGKKFQGPAAVLTHFTMYGDKDVQGNITRAFLATESVFANQPRRGNNHDVFWYKFQESSATAVIYMSFYGESTAIVRFKKILVAP